MKSKAYSINQDFPAGDGGAKDSLLLAAKKLFARKGLSGTTIRDIANEAGVNSSMISYYFDGKEGLYKSCLEIIGKSRLAIAEEILQPADNIDEHKLRLRLFVESMFQVFLSDRDTGLIIIREYDRVNSPAEKIFKDTFLRAFELLQNFFAHSQKQNFVSQEHDSFVIASLFFGSLFSQMRLDHLKEKAYNKSIKDPEEKKKLLDAIVSLFSNPQ